MAPQATLVFPTPTLQSSALPTPPPGNTSHKPFIPVALLSFLGLCFAYTFSYALYRLVKSRSRGSKEDTLHSSDRGVSQFINGARLSLNIGLNRKSALPTLNELPNVPEEEKQPADPSLPAPPEILVTSPAESSSTPFLALISSFTLHPNKEISQVQLPEQVSIEEKASISPTPPAPASTQQPFTQRIAAKVRFLSQDRAEAIALDPKLAPVQGPLRPLSMVTSPPHKKWTLFGVGLRPLRGHGENPDMTSQVR